MKKKILILTDGKDTLGKKFEGSKENHFAVKLELDLIVKILREDFYVECSRFDNLNLNKIYKEWYIVYTSSDERGLLYKDYIEDILLRLKKDGAILIPDFEYFRAHENKSFQEMLRKTFARDLEQELYSEVVGRFEDFDVRNYSNYPYVVKASSGAGSKGVVLAKNSIELRDAVHKLSRISYHDFMHPLIKDIIYCKPFWNIKRWIYRKLGKSHPIDSPLRYKDTNRVIIQKFVEGLSSDYKVLYFMGKYFVLNRKNRFHDFRASGSGMFFFPENIDQIIDILDFAKDMKEKIKAPMISMDIVKKEKYCYLIEFQCMNFGSYTLQYAEWYFEYNYNINKWIKVETVSELEHEMARSIKEYIHSLKECY